MAHYADIYTLGVSGARADRVLSNAHLANVGRDFGIYLVISLRVGQAGPATPEMVATAIEAIAGAAFKDQGMEAVRTVFLSLGLNNWAP